MRRFGEAIATPPHLSAANLHLVNACRLELRWALERRPYARNAKYREITDELKDVMEQVEESLPLPSQQKPATKKALAFGILLCLRKAHESISDILDAV